MKNEFTLAFNELLNDRQLPQEVVMEAVEAAMVSAYRKAVNASSAQHITANIDPETGKVSVFAEKEVVEEIQDDRTEVELEEARKVDAEADVGDMVIVETTPGNFGRVAAQTARQVIQQRIREAERDEQYKYFSTLVGEIINGIVQATHHGHITLGLEKKAEGIMPRNQQIYGERFRVHDRVRALLLEVKDTPRGPQIILSRAHPKFLRRLLEDEVPEIYHGMVEVRSIAREPGKRSKVAVAALQAGIDPVGACVGVRGVRIQAIVRELNDEKIDVIEWSDDPQEFIAKALSPARVVGVYLDYVVKGTKTATVVVPEDQLSLAIGRDGQNARLSAKLTGWRIDIKSLTEAATDTLYKLQNDEEYMPFAESEAENIPTVEAILTKKSEGRPVTPEEYKVLNRFVDRVEQKVADYRDAEKEADRKRRKEIRATIPDEAYDVPIEDLGIPLRYTIHIGGKGFSTAGDLMYQLELDPDVILGLEGITLEALEEIEEALAEFRQALPEKEAQPEEVEAVAEAEDAPEAEAASEVVEAEEEVQPEAEAEVETVAEAVVEAEVKEEEPVVAEAPPVEAESPVEEKEPEVEAVEEIIPVAEEDEEPVPEAVEETVLEEEDIEEEAPKEVVLAEEEEEEEEQEPLPINPSAPTIEAMFNLETLGLDTEYEYEDDDDEEEEIQTPSKKTKGKKKSKKHKKRFDEVVYDPDRDITYVKRKRKRSEKEDWDEDWEE